MKVNIKRAVNTLSALLVAGTLATTDAQEISTSLPLTSVGDRLMWAVGDQTLNLDVAVAGQIKLELYSPRIDPQDYRSDAYYGDETYPAPAGQAGATEPGTVQTVFSLLREDGSVVATQAFTPGAHSWEVLLDQNLPAGRYRLRAETQGNAKNTFAVRLSGVSAALSAERLSVNVHSKDWTPALNVSTDGPGYRLRMYDGDGAGELEAQLRDAQGNVTPLGVSEDLAWAELPLPAQGGPYVVELRQPEQAKQYSNTVSFALSREGGDAPITVTKVDQTGTLRVVAELVLPGSSQPTDVQVSAAGEPITVSGQSETTVTAGRYPVEVAPVPGADVTVEGALADVPKGGVGEVKVQVRPQVALDLQTDKPEVCVGDTLSVIARAVTPYAGELPLDLSVEASGLTLDGDNQRQGSFSAAQPGELRLGGTVTEPGEVVVRARLAGWDRSQEVRVQVLPAATSLQLSRTPLEGARVGETVTVRLSVRNTAAQPVTFTLLDQLGSGLKALDPVNFEGTLAAGETRELSYRAEVLSAQGTGLSARLDSPACSAPQQVEGSLNVLPAPVAAAPVAPAPVTSTPVTPAPVAAAPAEANPAPLSSRQSTVSLPFDAPSISRQLTVAQALPKGATYVPGSTRLNGEVLADPVRGPSGKLYWVIPAPAGQAGEKGAALRGVLSYEVTHAGALGELPAPSFQVELPGSRSETISGRVDAADLRAASRQRASTQVVENEGAIKLPAAGTVLRSRDRISVTVEAPQGDLPPLTVNGKEVSRDKIGTEVQDGQRGVQRVTFVGVPLQPGPNVLRFLDQEITVGLIGSTSRITVEPLNLVADGSTPLRLEVRALDAFGQLTTEPSVTVRTNLEPRTPDANPTQEGFQVRLVDGRGVVELQPQTAPTDLKFDVLFGQGVQPHLYSVRPDASRVGVGMVSATVGLNSGFSVARDLSWQARGYYEGPVGDGKVYIAADKDGLPTDRDYLVRNTVYGDASTESVPLQGIDPVALSYDHSKFRIEYRRRSLPVDVLTLGEQVTALTAYSKTNPRVSGFVALLPRDRVVNDPLTPDGTRVLRLGRVGVSLGTETLEVVTLERSTGKVLGRETLVRNVDYVLDPRSGIVTLNRALDRLDADLNERIVYASYRLDEPLAFSNRQLTYGVQAKVEGENYTAGVAAVQLDGRTTLGARATYRTQRVKTEALVAYSGGVQASLSATSTLSNHDLSFRARYQQASYQGLNPFTPGLEVAGKYRGRLTERLGLALDADYRDIPVPRSADAERSDVARGGNVTARAIYKFDPLTLGAGLSYAFGDRSGLSVVGSVGYVGDRVTAEVVHTQPVTGDVRPTTEIGAKFKLRPNLALGLSDRYTWGVGSVAAVTLDQTLGNTNYAVGYELPTASGAGNRARFGATTSLPLNDRTALGLRGSVIYDVARRNLETGAGADLSYKAQRVSASVGSDVAYNGEKGFGVVLRGGVTGSLSDALTLNASGLAEFGQGRSGQRGELGFAYRNRHLSGLGYARYLGGSLAGGQPELNLGASAEYRQVNWALRGGLETRTKLDDPSSFTWQGSVGGTTYLSDVFAVGAWGRVLSQPASQSTQLGYGLEAGLRAMPGTWVTAGYNFKGFEGLQGGSTYTKQGAYLRLDLTLDDGAGRR